MTTTPTFPAVVFSVTDAGIAELEAKHKGLVVAHGDKKGYLALTQAIAEVRTARTDVEKRRKELKAEAEAARPDRERMIAYVRQCLDGMPDVSTEIGNHYVADLRECLSALLDGWMA